jgi:hypothetical protein
LREHAFIDGEALVREGIDEGDLGCEGWIEEVSIGQAFAFGDEADTFGIRRKIQLGRVIRCGLVGGFSLANRGLLAPIPLKAF